MNGILKVIDALGNTIIQLEELIKEVQAENERLKIGSNPHPPAANQDKAQTQDKKPR